KMDEVMEESLAKNPNIRTKSVGALADAIGAAYGLVGDHKQWAKTPIAELARQVEEAKPRAMAAQRTPAPVEVAADPFASPPQQQPQQAWGAPPQQQAQGPYGYGMQQSYGTMDPAMSAAGVPAKTNWVLPVILAAVFFLLIGGGIAVFALMR